MNFLSETSVCMSLNFGLQSILDGLVKFCLNDGQLAYTMYFSLHFLRLRLEFLTKFVQQKHC